MLIKTWARGTLPGQDPNPRAGTVMTNGISRMERLKARPPSLVSRTATHPPIGFWACGLPAVSGQRKTSLCAFPLFSEPGNIDASIPAPLKVRRMARQFASHKAWLWIGRIRLGMIVTMAVHPHGEVDAAQSGMNWGAQSQHSSFGWS